MIGSSFHSSTSWQAGGRRGSSESSMATDHNGLQSTPSWMVTNKDPKFGSAEWVTENHTTKSEVQQKFRSEQHQKIRAHSSWTSIQQAKAEQSNDSKSCRTKVRLLTESPSYLLLLSLMIMVSLFLPDVLLVEEKNVERNAKNHYENLFKKYVFFVRN